MNKSLKRIRPIKSIFLSVYQKLRNTKKSFSNTTSYWEARYQSGGNSGDGSYGELAKFKATFLNSFVKKHSIINVIEYGCGDGHQLSLANYPSYIGFDVSKKAIQMCSAQFSEDRRKSFALIGKYYGQKAELTLSLDVIFHLIEEEVFEQYMCRLFDSAERYVIIYSSNTDKNDPDQSPHFKNRFFSKWVENYRPQWKLEVYMPNEFPFNEEKGTGSVSDFYVYSKKI